MEYSIGILQEQLSEQRSRKKGLMEFVKNSTGEPYARYQMLHSSATKKVEDLRKTINILLYGTPKWYHRKHRLNVLRKHYGAQPYKTS